MKTIHVIITSLVLDLLAFTLILPLFPRILLQYQQQQDPLMLLILDYISNLRTRFQLSDRFDLIIFGGLLGSLYSCCQFIVSPFIGSLSDRYFLLSRY
jgi:hypothetical protein